MPSIVLGHLVVKSKQFIVRREDEYPVDGQETNDVLKNKTAEWISVV